LSLGISLSLESGYGGKACPRALIARPAAG
jgi:hypothetical protein